MVIHRETIELAFLVALQCLPPKQRAVLILRDVLDWSAQETAILLHSSTASVNAALQRARATLRRQQPSRDNPPRPRGITENGFLKQYADATERVDTEALIQLLRDDARFTMPPAAIGFVGNRATVQAWVEGGFGCAPYSDFRCVLTSAKLMPAIAIYWKRPGDAQYRPFMIDVLKVEAGRVAEVTVFELPRLVDAFALPSVLPPESDRGSR